MDARQQYNRVRTNLHLLVLRDRTLAGPRTHDGWENMREVGNSWTFPHTLDLQLQDQLAALSGTTQESMCMS